MEQDGNHEIPETTLSLSTYWNTNTWTTIQGTTGCIQYSSPNIVRVIKSKRMKWAGHVARMEEGKGVYRVLVGRPEGKRPLRRPRGRWEDNIKLDFRDKGIDGANWIRLSQDRV
jgi:hypothetical protein